MDPCAVLPPEVLESVWSNLDERDLLASRAVSQDWRTMLEDSKVWKRLTFVPTGVSPWEFYLEECRVAYAWAWGNFKTNTLDPGMELSEGKICLGKNHVYLMKDSTILMYDKTLKKVWHVHHFPDDWRPVKMKCEGDLLAVMTANGRQRAMEILNNWKLVSRCPAVGTSFSIGLNGEVVFECEEGLAVWHEGVSGVITRPPEGDIEELVITKALIGAMVRHSVRQGAGFTVYRKMRYSPSSPWETSHCERNTSPLKTVNGKLVASEHRMLSTAFCLSHHWTSIKQILIDENDLRCNHTELGYLSGPYLALGIFEHTGHDDIVIENLDTGKSCKYALGGGRPYGFFCRSLTRLVVPFKDGTIRGYRDSCMAYEAPLGMNIVGSQFVYDTALIWNKETAVTLTIKLPNDPDPSSDLPTIRLM